MNRIPSELLLAFRRLTREPVTTLLAVLALALGIGFTATLWSLLHGTLGRDLPFEDPEHLVAIGLRDLAQGAGTPVYLPDFHAWSDRQQSFEGLAAHQTFFTYVTAETGGTQTWIGAYTTASTFSLLRVEPAFGRGLTAEDEEPGAPPVAVVSHRLWQRQLGGQTDVVGTTLKANSRTATIVGVLPEGFHFPYRHDIWLPLEHLGTEAAGKREWSTRAFVFGRLRDGVPIETARAELEAITKALPEAADATTAGVLVEPYVENLTDPEAAFAFRMLFAAVVGVLLIACANVANLLLARSVRRGREVGVRAALGASRRQLAAEALAESLVLAAVGGAGGLALAHVGVELLRRHLDQAVRLGYWVDVRLDATTLAVTLAAVSAACVLAGFVPAWRSASADPRAGLSSAGRGATAGRRMRRLTASLVVVQVGLSCVLLTGSAVLGRAVLGQLEATQLARGDVLSAQVSIVQTGWRERERRAGFYDELERRLDALPGVESVTLGTSLPYSPGWTTYVSAEGRPAAPEEAATVRWVAASPSYFETFGVPILSGRGLRAGDLRSEDRGTVVNRSFVERHLQGLEPLGRRIYLGTGDRARETTIVGVVDDVAAHPYESGDPSAVYTLLGRTPAESVRLAVRSAGDPLTLAEAIRREVTALERESALYEVRTFAAEVSRATWSYRLFTVLLAIFASSALLLAAIGLFGVLSFTVSQHGHEYGVRSALGATPSSLLVHVLSTGLAQVGTGLAAGFAGAAALSRLLVGFFPEVDPRSLAVHAVVAGVLVLTGLLASWWPARRASRSDPVEALRQDG